MELLSYYAYLRKCYPISIFSREVRALSSHSEVSIPSASEPTSVLFLANTTSKTTQIEHKSLIPTSNKSAKATTMAPTKLECITCQDDTKTAEDFPSRPPTSECRHPIRSCKICLEAWITTEIDDAVYIPDAFKFGIAYPDDYSCAMRNLDIRAATTAATYLRFDHAERRHIAANMPGWRWCMNPRCDAGDVRVYSTCGARACVPCDRPYHDGENCEAYQARVDMGDGEEVHEKIEQISVPCPHCGTRILRRIGGA